jgi:hypothetical protein
LRLSQPGGLENLGKITAQGVLGHLVLRERQPGGVVEERERLWNGQAEKLKQH